MDCMLAWIEAHPGLSSWLQAFFSSVAILVAIIVPLRQNKHALKMLKKEFKYAKRLEDKKIASESREKIAAILAIVSQVQAFTNLTEQASRETGWHFIQVDTTYLDVTIEQLKNLPIFDIPDPKIIVYVATLPVSIIKMKDEWKTFQERSALSGQSTSIEDFLAEKENVKSLISDCIRICEERILALNKIA